ncbi:endonuclease/exonuclease/phosphatase family protein [Bacteroides faecalis]
MRKLIICVLLFLLGSGEGSMLRATKSSATVFLKALQMNIWKGGSGVEGAVDMIADEIIHSGADVVFLNELSDYKGENFILHMIKELKQRGHTFYGTETSLSVGILTRYPIEEQRIVCPPGKGSNGAVVRVLLSVAGRKVAAYATHLDYRHYACYMPRGYNGSTWKKMDAPVTDEATVLEMNRKAYREETIADFLQKVQPDIEQGYAVLLGGDFNEPSHLDWQNDTKDLWDHNGAVVNWDCSKLLYEGGFKDAYRVVHPNPVTHPGFTFPAGNKAVSVDKLTWAPEADERDRIDFIYYYPTTFMTPEKAWVVGPEYSVIKSEIKKEKTRDRFLRPKGGWPTDHKAVMVSFKMKSAPENCRGKQMDKSDKTDDMSFNTKYFNKLSAPLSDDLIYSKAVYLKRNRVVQCIDIARDGDIYYVQIAGSDEHQLNVLKGAPNATRPKDCMVLEYFGHGTNMAIEETNGEAYVWMGSHGNKGNDGAYGGSQTISRVKYEPGKKVTLAGGDVFHLKGTRNIHPAVNPEKDLLGVQYSKNISGVNNRFFKVYRLSEAMKLPLSEVKLETLKYGGDHSGNILETLVELTIKAKELSQLQPLYEFSVPDGELYFQGYDIDDKFVYYYEGIGNDNKIDTPSRACVRVYDKKGNLLGRKKVAAISNIIRLKELGLADRGYMEAEGIKIKGDTMYLGFASRKMNGKADERLINVLKYTND